MSNWQTSDQNGFVSLSTFSRDPTRFGTAEPHPGSTPGDPSPLSLRQDPGARPLRRLRDGAGAGGSGATRAPPRVPPGVLQLQRL